MTKQRGGWAARSAVVRFVLFSLIAAACHAYIVTPHVVSMAEWVFQGWELSIIPPGTVVYLGTTGLIELATLTPSVMRFLKDLKVGSPLCKVISRQLATRVPGNLAAGALHIIHVWAYMLPGLPFIPHLRRSLEIFAVSFIIAIFAAVLVVCFAAPEVLMLAIKSLHQRAQAFTTPRLEIKNQNIAGVWKLVDSGTPFNEVQRSDAWLALTATDQHALRKQIESESERDKLLQNGDLYLKMSNPNELSKMTRPQVEAFLGVFGFDATKCLVDKWDAQQQSDKISER